MRTEYEELKSLKNEMEGKYLTEERLGKILKIIFRGYEWIHDEKFQANGETYNFRPDYCCHELQMCIEFDGPDHFTKASVIQADIKKDQIIEWNGYDIIRVPYFVQLNSAGIKYFFNFDIDFDYNFRHGFVSRNVSLPANFCEQGIWKFNDFIADLNIEEDNPQAAREILSDIKESLINKINSLKLPEAEAMLNVVPSKSMLSLGLANYSHNSVDNMNKVRSTLKNNWNCVLLESSQTIMDQAGTYDIRYTYNAEGNISGCSYKEYNKLGFSNITLLVEKENEDEVNIRVFKNHTLILDKLAPMEEINIFNLVHFLP